MGVRIDCLLPKEMQVKLSAELYSDQGIEQRHWKCV